MEVVPFSGWQRNARLVCNDVEMIITLEVGPRIIGYGFIGGPNEMAVAEKSAGKTGGDSFISYGGHRLWIAPELDPTTFQPDNGPVNTWEEEGWYVFSTPADKFHLEKQFRVKPDPANHRFLLEHRIVNHGGYDVELAPWTPTQMATGGECIFPQAKFIPHTDKVLPARPLVLWHYTNMADDRWTWGEKVIRLRWADRGPQKVGALVDQGIVVYANHGNVYLRRFRYEEGATYPDYGVNFETFTRHDMLEVETLSPLQKVAKNGGYASHFETWYLFKDLTPPAGDAECAAWLEDLAGRYPL